MGKLSVRSAIAAPKFEVEDEVLDFFDEQEDKRHAYELANDESWLYWQQYSEPRAFALEFYNFMVGAGDAVIDIYRQFDHVLMTWEQARAVAFDVANELADLIDLRGNESGNVYATGSNTVEVEFRVYDDDNESRWYTAFVSVVPVDEVDVLPRKVDALDDRFWEDEFSKKARINELETKITYLADRMARLKQDHERTWSNWVWWVKEGREYVERVCRDSERYREQYLAGRRYETRKEALGVLDELNKTKAEFRKLKSELRKLAA